MVWFDWHKHRAAAMTVLDVVARCFQRTRSGRKISCHILLVGGGHAQVAVLKAFGERPIEGIRLTLVAKEAMAPYSGMLPGTIAGRHAAETGMIDLAALARFAGATFVHDSATAIDPDHKRVERQNGSPIAYDVLSIDVGIVPDVSAIEGARENALLVKPVSTFLQRWRARIDREGETGAAVVVGGGAAGFELAHAMRERLDRLGGKEKGGTVRGGDLRRVTLVGGRHWMQGLPKRGRRLARASLDENRIDLIEGERALAVGPSGVTLEGGGRLPADVVLVSTAAQPPTWLAATGLALADDGSILVRETLQVADRPDVFAAGDCAQLIGQKRPKAGVYAVRQGEYLAANLRRHALGKPLKRYRAQRHALAILSLASGDAIAVKGRFALRARLAQKLKDRIDRRFVARYSVERQQPE